MAEKMLRLKTCAGCECLEMERNEDGDPAHYWCTHPENTVDDTELWLPLTIPPWCKLEDAPRWVAVASGELPEPLQLVEVLICSELRELSYLIRMPHGHEWSRRGTLAFLSGVTHWLAGMPPLPAAETLPKEATDAE